MTGPLATKTCLSLAQEAMAVLNGKWSFLVLAKLYHGPRRFNALRKALVPISTKMLTDTLRHLEQNQIIQRQAFLTVPVTVEYSLTEKGKDFQAIMTNMYAWAQKWEDNQGEAHPDNPDSQNAG